MAEVSIEWIWHLRFTEMAAEDAYEMAWMALGLSASGLEASQRAAAGFRIGRT